ncbi:hypothetical protein D3C81_2303630 [compost metagenome]
MPTVATSTPARAGPTVTITPMLMPPRALAAGRSRVGRRRGVIACRVLPIITDATALMVVST